MPRRGKSTAGTKAGAGSAAPRRRGRPKGSKNKPKPAVAEESVKRGPGRPKGSGTKPKVTAVVAKRGPGRPPKTTSADGSGTATVKAPTRRRRRRRAKSTPATIGARIQQLISQLEAIKTEIRQLEPLRDALDRISKI